MTTPSVRVLMVTGAYYPELSGGGLQARAIVHALRHTAQFLVLTTSIDASLPANADDQGVPVRRIHVDVTRLRSRVVAAWQFAAAFVHMARGVDVVNVHGFSKKMILLVALSRLCRKPIALTLQTGGDDEPTGADALGRIAGWAYRQADLYLSVSPGLSRAYAAAGLPAARLRQVCNAVDIERFRPAGSEERAALRRQLGLPLDLPVVLFVGYFSRDKRPDLLAEVWLKVTPRCALVFVGATMRSYHEVDPQLADSIRRRAGEHRRGGDVWFVERSHAIEQYFRAADLYVLPSVREGLPIALLEAMASGLPCVATRLPGATDTLIADGVNGRLVPADDVAALRVAIESLLHDGEEARRLGAAARQTIVDEYSIQRTSGAWHAAYRELARRQSADRRTAESPLQ